VNCIFWISHVNFGGLCLGSNLNIIFSGTSILILIDTKKFKQKKELEREQKGTETSRIENLDDRNTQLVEKS